jgi:DMSO reductase anchor subunit
MHPAYSVIFFTTASGAGYGVWFLLGLRLVMDDLPDVRAPFVVSLVIGGLLVTLGLLSSTFHLGHPERAWRAFSQWRSSWLSREGVAAVATYLPAALLFLALILPGDVPFAGIAGALLSLGAVLTVWCTGMIYASLRTVPEWHQALVPVIYMVLALGTGAVLLGTLLSTFGVRSVGILSVAAISLALSGVFKWVYWQRIDGAAAPYTLTQAIGIPGAAAVRPLDPPHTQPNFVMREMGYAVARRHAMRLRRLVLALVAAVPVAAVICGIALPGASLPFFIVAILSAGAGVWIERWLFFAEARHVSMLYYGTELGGAEARGA